MFSIRSASVIATVAFGLMGYATEGFAETPASHAATNYDPSSLYQPTPNSRPLAVAPPVGVTGAVGNGLRVAPAKAPSATASVDASSFYQPSPNSRALAVAPPVNVTGAVGSSVQAAPKQVASVKPAAAEKTPSKQ